MVVGPHWALYQECAGEGRQKFVGIDGVATQYRRETVKYGQRGHGTRNQNDCADETQQRFSRPNSVERVLSYIVSSRCFVTTSEQTEDFTCAVVVVIYRVCKSVRLLVICSYEL
jgi:hypothetical protein